MSTVSHKQHFSKWHAHHSVCSEARTLARARRPCSAPRDGWFNIQSQGSPLAESLLPMRMCLCLYVSLVLRSRVLWFGRFMFRSVAPHPLTSRLVLFCLPCLRLRLCLPVCVRLSSFVPVRILPESVCACRLLLKRLRHVEATPGQMLLRFIPDRPAPITLCRMHSMGRPRERRRGRRGLRLLASGGRHPGGFSAVRWGGGASSVGASTLRVDRGVAQVPVGLDPVNIDFGPPSTSVMQGLAHVCDVLMLQPSVVSHAVGHCTCVVSDVVGA